MVSGSRQWYLSARTLGYVFYIICFFIDSWRLFEILLYLDFDVFFNFKFKILESQRSTRKRQAPKASPHFLDESDGSEGFSIFKLKIISILNALIL